MSALEPVILSKVTEVSRAVAAGQAPAIGMAALFPTSKAVLQLGNTEWLRSGVIAPRESYPQVPDYLTLLGTTYGAPENGSLPSSVGIVSVAVAGALVVVTTSGNNVFVSKDRGVTWAIASGVSAISVFEANGYVYATYSSTLRRTLNGDAWESCTGVMSSLCGIAYGNGVYVAVPAGSESVCWTSPDGITFTQKPLGSPAASKFSVCFVNGFFLAAQAGTVSGPYVSYDGSSWVASTLASGQTYSLLACVSAADRAYIITSVGVFESLDGVSFTKVGALPSGFTSTPYFPKCFFSDGLLCVFGTTSLLLANNPAFFVSVVLSSGVAHSASVSGEYLVCGVAASTNTILRRRLNKMVGSPKFVNNTYYRVK